MFRAEYGIGTNVPDGNFGHSTQGINGKSPSTDGNPTIHRW